MIRIQEAFIDHTTVKEEVILKIVEVQTWAEEYDNPRKKAKAAKKRSDSSSSDSKWSCDDSERDLVMADIKTIKGFLRVIRKRARALPQGIRGWYDHFDADGSDEIEFKEFVRMI